MLKVHQVFHQQVEKMNMTIDALTKEPRHGGGACLAFLQHLLDEL